MNREALALTVFGGRRSGSLPGRGLCVARGHGLAELFELLPVFGVVGGVATPGSVNEIMFRLRRGLPGFGRACWQAFVHSQLFILEAGAADNPGKDNFAVLFSLAGR